MQAPELFFHFILFAAGMACMATVMAAATMIRRRPSPRAPLQPILVPSRNVEVRSQLVLPAILLEFGRSLFRQEAVCFPFFVGCNFEKHS